MLQSFFQSSLSPFPTKTFHLSDTYFLPFHTQLFLQNAHLIGLSGLNMYRMAIMH